VEVRTEERLNRLRDGLLRLHKVLLDSERSVYDHDIQRIRSTGELLSLVLHDPWFAWLHELSTLVVQIDERLAADEPATRSDADLFVVHARSLLAPSEDGEGFEKRYFEALQRDPNVILAHAEMMRVLAAVS
jgi:hypothetical protein